MSKSKHSPKVSKAGKTLASPKSTPAQKSKAGKTLQGHKENQH